MSLLVILLIKKLLKMTNSCTGCGGTKKDKANKEIFAVRELQTKRVRICASCPNVDKTKRICKACGCIVRAKASLLSSKCPKGFW